MVRLVLASVKRPMVRPTGGATSPAGHHQDPSFFPVSFSDVCSMALLSVPQVTILILMRNMVELETRL